MKQKILKNIELYIFLVFSLVAVYFFYENKYIPSLDGPQHLYSARLITELLQGNDFISQYFRFNPVIVGNQTSLYIMALLMFVFPAWIAEKLFLTLYVAGMGISFRYFIRSVRPGGTWMYMLIFPFIFTSLFMLGYYNFSLAFVFLFFTLGYFKRTENRIGTRQLIWLTLLTTLIYLSHAVVFVFFGMIMILQLIFDSVYPVLMKKYDRKEMIIHIKRYSYLLIAALPAIIFWGLYYVSMGKGSSGPELEYQAKDEIFNTIYHLKTLIGFHHQQESGPNILLFWGLVAFILLAFVPFGRLFPKLINVKPGWDKEWARWTFITVFTLIVIFLMPDRLVTGNMTARIIILFFFLLVIWISLQTYPKAVVIMALLLIFASMTWHRQIVSKFYGRLNSEIAEIERAGQYIDKNTVIFPVNCSENWVQLHFHCYLGVDKPMVNLKNPQAYGPMPLVWNYDRMPRLLMGELDQKRSGMDWPYGKSGSDSYKIDHVFFWRVSRLDKLPDGIEFRERILPYYSESYTSQKGNLALYSLKK